MEAWKQGEQSMEKRLTQLFGYQKFEQNAHLASLIKDTESRYSVVQSEELSDDALAEVSAAGGADSGSPIGLIGIE